MARSDGPFEPSFVPPKPAARLAAAVCGPITAQPVELHRIVDSLQAGAVDPVIELVYAAKDLHPAAAILDHFRHEWQPVHHAFGIEGREDLVEAAHLDLFSGAQR